MRRQPRRGLPEWKNEIGAVPLGSGTNSESGAYMKTDRTVAIRLWGFHAQTGGNFRVPCFAQRPSIF